MAAASVPAPSSLATTPLLHQLIEDSWATGNGPILQAVKEPCLEMFGMLVLRRKTTTLGEETLRFAAGLLLTPVNRDVPEEKDPVLPAQGTAGVYGVLPQLFVAVFGIMAAVPVTEYGYHLSFAAVFYHALAVKVVRCFWVWFELTGSLLSAVNVDRPLLLATNKETVECLQYTLDRIVSSLHFGLQFLLLTVSACWKKIVATLACLVDFGPALVLNRDCIYCWLIVFVIVSGRWLKHTPAISHITEVEHARDEFYYARPVLTIDSQPWVHVLDFVPVILQSEISTLCSWVCAGPYLHSIIGGQVLAEDGAYPMVGNHLSAPKEAGMLLKSLQNSAAAKIMVWI